MIKFILECSGCLFPKQPLGAAALSEASGLTCAEATMCLEASEASPALLRPGMGLAECRELDKRLLSLGMVCLIKCYRDNPEQNWSFVERRNPMSAAMLCNENFEERRARVA